MEEILWMLPSASILATTVSRNVNKLKQFARFKRSWLFIYSFLNKYLLCIDSIWPFLKTSIHRCLFYPYFIIMIRVWNWLCNLVRDFSLVHSEAMLMNLIVLVRVCPFIHNLVPHIRSVRLSWILSCPLSIPKSWRSWARLHEMANQSRFHHGRSTTSFTTVVLHRYTCAISAER